MEYLWRKLLRGYVAERENEYAEHQGCKCAVTREDLDAFRESYDFDNEWWWESTERQFKKYGFRIAGCGTTFCNFMRNRPYICKYDNIFDKEE